MRGQMTDRYRKLVEEGSDNFYGLSIINHAKEIGALIARHEARSAIDYGCGRGDQYAAPYELGKLWGLDDVYKYDPAFATHDTLPHEDARFDAVLCSDVLEHVPMDEVDAFVRTLFHLADKFVWASVCCRPAKKLFREDMVNMHVTVKPFSWWAHKFEATQKQTDLFSGGREVPFYLIETP